MAYSSATAALAGAAMLASSFPAAAQVVRFDPAMTQAASSLVTNVQFQGGHGMRRLPGGGFHGGGGVRSGGFHGGTLRHGGFADRGGSFRGGRGAAIGAGVAGLAAGALIGGALASQPGYGYDGGYGYNGGYGAPVYGGDPGYGYAAPPVYAEQPAQVDDASGYCAQRYKSYDPTSGTFLGYDGQRHPCPTT